MVAFDRTLAMGPEPFAEDSGSAIMRIAEHGVDAILLSPGLIKQHGRLLAYRGAPAVVCRLDFPFLGSADRGSGEQFRLVASVEEAAALGADAVVMFHTLGYRDKRAWADNIAAIGTVAERARRIGVPLIVEAVPWGAEASDPRDPQAVAGSSSDRCGARRRCDQDRVRRLGLRDGRREPLRARSRSSCSAAPGSGSPGFQSSHAAPIEGGATGVIYGRNVWQRDDLADVAAALTRTVHGREVHTR